MNLNKIMLYRISLQAFPWHAESLRLENGEKSASRQAIMAASLFEFGEAFA